MLTGRKKIALVAVSLVILFAILILVGNVAREKRLAPFKPQLANYLAAPDRKHSDYMFRSGKLIVVDIGAQDFDSLFFMLPDKVAAQTPEEVGTIAQLKWGKKRWGSYSEFADPAYVQICDVTLVDKKTMKVIEERRYFGANPPETKHIAESGTGPRPDTEVVNYLKTLY